MKAVMFRLEEVARPMAKDIQVVVVVVVVVGGIIAYEMTGA